ncbi:MAG: amidohydrolase family protein [Acidobacteria bacterium]|jgi:cytosine/adenosine deaminase-related metal-dependent hydrolase|nr:amidohydrolase family protein [Acidobacteriota bacterium]
MALYLKNATYIDWETLEFKKTSLKVNEGIDGKIEFIPGFNIKDEKDTLDCTGKLVTQSFVCGHHHAYSALARGMGAPKKIPVNFLETLQYIWWTLDKCLDQKMIEASALTTALYCAKNGVTFVIDHHASPFAIENSLTTIAEAFDKIGISHLLCYELSDRDGIVSRQKGLEETENYFKKKKQALVGLHASFTVGNELLKLAVNLAEKYNSGIHVHTAEDVCDQESTLKDYGKRVIERFSRAGILNFRKTILAHCIHLEQEERYLIRESPAFVVQNTESNLNNNVGVFNSRGLGDNIMLGTDGMHSDMLRSAKAAYLVGQGAEIISPDVIYRRFRKVQHYLKANDFKGVGENNLVILNYDSPTEIRQDNFTGHFVYGIDSRHVESVIANGRLIVQNGKILTVNENEILQFSREMGVKLWEKMRKQG